MATFPERVNEPVVQTLAADLEKTLCRHIEELLQERDWEHIQIRDDILGPGHRNETFNICRSVNLGSLSQKYDDPPYLHLREVLIPTLFEEFYRKFEDIIYGFDPDKKSRYMISLPKVQAAIRDDTWEAMFDIRFEYAEWEEQIAVCKSGVGPEMFIV